MSISNKQLKELLNQYPDESFIYIHDDDCDNSCRHIGSIDVKYFDSDEYAVPDIILF